MTLTAETSNVQVVRKLFEAYLESAINDVCYNGAFRIRIITTENRGKRYMEFIVESGTS